MSVPPRLPEPGDDSGTVRPPSCADCGSLELQSLGNCSPSVTTRNLPLREQRLGGPESRTVLYRCRECFLSFRHPRVASERLADLYTAMPMGRWTPSAERDVAWPLARKLLSRCLSGLDSPRVLDIGAFDGAFLEGLPAHWRRAAVEPSTSAQPALREAGVEVIDDFIGTPSAPWRGTFDAVTMFDVFEHLPEPKRSLSQVVEYLAPGGVLLISTGNASHWSWTLLGGYHWYCDSIQHTSFGCRDYFSNVAQHLSCRVQFIESHPHQRVPARARFRQALETVVFAGHSGRTGWHLLRKALLSLPWLSALRHRVRGPYAPGLSDHLLVCLSKDAGQDGA